VSACLTTLSIAHTKEHWCERSEHSIDLALLERTPPLALEVDGPSHFLQNGQQDGQTRMRDRLLKAHGWRVAVVNVHEWRALRTQTEREAYLTQLVEAATAAPHVLRMRDDVRAVLDSGAAAAWRLMYGEQEWRKMTSVVSASRGWVGSCALRAMAIINNSLRFDVF
jgi:hypothetical protein